MNQPTQRWVARALRAGGPEVIEVGLKELPPLRTGEALFRVEAVGLNHAETLIRSGNYTVRLPFPYPLGGEGSGVVVATGQGADFCGDSRVLGSGYRIMRDFCDGANFYACSDSRGPQFRRWRVPGSRRPNRRWARARLAAQGAGALVWGAAGAVGRMLVAILAGQQVEVIGIASGKRADAVRAAGAIHVIDPSR